MKMTVAGRSNQEWVYNDVGGTSASRNENFTFNLTGTHTFVSTCTNGAGTDYSLTIVITVTGSDVLNAFAATAFTVSAPTSNGYTNGVSGDWTMDGPANISYSVTLDHAATASDPVFIVGSNGSVTLTSGTSYSATVSLSTGTHAIRVFRSAQVPLTNVTLSISKSGAGVFRAISGTGMCTASNYTNLRPVVTVSGITGYYHFNVRDCTNQTDNNSAANLNNASDSQTAIASTTGNTISFIEFVNYSAGFSAPVVSPSEYNTYSMYVIADGSGVSDVYFLSGNWAVLLYHNSTIPAYSIFYTGICAASIYQTERGDAGLDYSCGAGYTSPTAPYSGPGGGAVDRWNYPIAAF